jgi:hypothetical protein
MKKVNGSSKFGYVCHFEDDERGDIYFSLAHQGESCASVAQRYEVSPSVIRRAFGQIANGDVPIGDPSPSVSINRPEPNSRSNSQTHEAPLRELEIDFDEIYTAYCRDQFVSEPWAAYLNVESGAVEWLYDRDEDAESLTGSSQENSELRELIARSPDRYVDIPVLAYSERHGFLDQFLASDWTSDPDLKQRAEKAHGGSIRKWIDELDDDATEYAFRDFQYEASKASAEELLREEGIEPIWK